MTEVISTGLVLLLVGMTTVLATLGIVVATGRVLISVVNRFPGSPDDPIKPPDAQVTDPSGAKIAAITGAIHELTGGKGQITHIERLE